MQPHLPSLAPEHHVDPTAGRDEPLVWVRRLRVLRELRSADEHMIRDVGLRPGLNIVWAPPHDASGENTLFKSGVAGHTAGKTTFCRLIRHALGEGTFARKAVKSGIRDKLPTAWLVAEIILAGEPWAVARPLGIGPASFCIRGGDANGVFADTERRDYADFLDALESATLSGLAAKTFARHDQPIRWAHILPWLTRDQECRFADFMVWRHPSSDSDAPNLSDDDRQLLVRSVLGLISDAEREEQALNARLNAQKKKATGRAPLLGHQAKIDHDRVEKLLGIKVPGPSSGLLANEARVELDRRSADVDKRLAELAASDRREELRKHWEEAVLSEGVAKQRLDEAQSRHDHVCGTLDQLAKPGDLFAKLKPPTDFCQMPYTAANAARCPMNMGRPADLAIRRAERTAEEELRDQEQTLDVLAELVSARRRALDAATAVAQTALKPFLRENTAYTEEYAELRSERAGLNEVERRIRHAEEAWQSTMATHDEIRRLAVEMNESHARQRELRKQRRQALNRFSSVFDYVLRALLGDEVRGRVHASGGKLTLHADHHGARESAAIETVKLLAFDLAALTASIQGQGVHPRFLLHDGPREADLSPDIYARLFLLAQNLEACFAKTPGFQYILTTTTAPPDAFATPPWLRLSLAGEPTAQRLLRLDL